MTDLPDFSRVHALLVAANPPARELAIRPAQAADGISPPPGYAGSHGLFACSFEELCVRLNALPRLDCEPDGAFVWVGSDRQNKEEIRAQHPPPCEFPGTASIDDSKIIPLKTPDLLVRTWQMEGQLSDRQGKICAVEVKGSCPRWAWQKLLECCGHPQVPLRVILPISGQSLEAGEFLSLVHNLWRNELC